MTQLLDWQTQVIGDIINAEGEKYTNRSNDRGGPTKFGVTLKTLRAYRKDDALTAEAVMKLTKSEAQDIYESEYAAPFSFVECKELFSVLVNGGVNHGVGAMTKMLQQVVKVNPDGDLGPVTRKAVIDMFLSDPVKLTCQVVAKRAALYAHIIVVDESQRANAAGWFNRLADDLTW